MRPDAKSSNPTSTMPPPHMARRMTRGSMLGSSGSHGSFAPQDGHTVASRATSVAHSRQGTVSASTLVMRQPRRWTCGWSILRHALMNATIAFSSTVFVSIRVHAVSAALCPLAHDDYFAHSLRLRLRHLLAQHAQELLRNHRLQLLGSMDLLSRLRVSSPVIE